MATAEQPSPEQLARREAALARVRKYGDPVLRETARPVAAVDAVTRDQIAEMRRLVEDAGEAGLAATQLGILNRVFVYRTDPEGPVRALVNPEVKPLFVARSTTKPVSLLLLSAHVRLIWLVETAVAARFVGAAGAATCGVADASADSALSPAALTADTL